MRLRTTAIIAGFSLLVFAAAFAQTTCPPSGSLSFPITLSGAQFGGQGSATGFGTGFVTLNPANSTATVQLNTFGLGPNVTSAGLFTNGGSAVPFFTAGSAQNGGTGAITDQPTFDQNGNFSRTVTLTPQQMNAILANPSAFNFSVATGELPNGAISGSLMGTTTFSGTFSGSNVVGATGATNGGGAFTASVVPNATGSGSTLFFNVTPIGIGNNFTGLSLNQGGVGANGSQVINLSNGGTFTNGRFTGSVQLTDAQAQSLLANAAGFNLTTKTAQFPNGAVRAQFAMAQNELWLPVAGSVRGALGNQWTTDLRVYNQSSTAPATVTMELFPLGQSNATSGGAMNAFGASVFSVTSRGTGAVPTAQNVLASFNGLGAIRLTSDQPIIAVERIYDANGGPNTAASAQAIFGKSMCEATARGVLVGISNTSVMTSLSGSGVHSNIGFFNPNPTAVTLQVNLGNAQGGAIGTMQTMTLQPFQLVQSPLIGTPGNGLFNGNSDISDAAVTFQASAPIFAYTSVVNNANGDTHLTFAKPDVSVPGVALSDLAAIVTAANQGEILEGQVAMSRSANAAVRQFAQQMINDHTAALAQAQSAFAAAGVSASSANATAQFLAAQTQQDIAALNVQSGPTLDRTYMQLQVTDHQKVLQMLDTMLIPSAAGSPQLLPLLQQMRATVAQHLTTAQSILSQLP